jgi:hypothetical protein
MTWSARGRICAPAMLTLSTCVTTQPSSIMFDESQFAQLHFLEGRFHGTGADRKPFFEEYVFTSGDRLEARRYSDSSFTAQIDSSAVTLVNGEVTSTWGEFTWRAISLAPTKACFNPINAPSSFCWERADDQTVVATHRWTGPEGNEQTQSISLTRVSR